ncbi:MAG: hypothetical protein MZU97_18715 [Bacillus subtilis]|nr:hypothetical protein [Bacillus subtilis]
MESNLSTFAAHVENITEIPERSDPKSLVLIDELGTGTDPDEGAALSCAVLKELRETKAFVFATTHLTDIKGFVQRTEGMVNASMEFDRRTLTPSTGSARASRASPTRSMSPAGTGCRRGSSPRHGR